MAGGIDDVDAVVVPEAGRGRGRDGDAALLLLRHPVHGRSSVVDLTHLVGDPRIEQDSLRRRRLTGIDVRHDADIANPLQRSLPSHVKEPRAPAVWSPTYGSQEKRVIEPA